MSRAALIGNGYSSVTQRCKNIGRHFCAWLDAIALLRSRRNDAWMMRFVNRARQIIVRFGKFRVPSLVFRAPVSAMPTGVVQLVNRKLVGPQVSFRRMLSARLFDSELALCFPVAISLFVVFRSEPQVRIEDAALIEVLLEIARRAVSVGTCRV